MRVILCAVGAVSALFVARQATEQWSPTEPPRLLESDTSLIPLLTWADYQRIATTVQSNRKDFIVLAGRPNLSADARFSFNLSFAGKNRSLAVDGSQERGYRLFADSDGNGRFTDDETISFDRIANRLSAVFRTTVTETTAGSTDRYAVEMRFVLDKAIPPGEKEAIPVLRRYSTTARRGVAQVAGSPVAFALVGHAGIYDTPSDQVVFDLSGRGLEQELADDKSPNRYQVGDVEVSLNGLAYRLHVERYGRGLALQATDSRLAPRPSLAIGTIAPAFSLQDLSGTNHRLSDYRGKVVLLTFWASWCGPCRAEAPQIADAYRRFSANGFVVLGINANDSLDDIQRFAKQYQVSWPISREPIDGALHKLFRVTGWPANYLIGKDGSIIANQLDGSLLVKMVGEALK